MNASEHAEFDPSMVDVAAAVLDQLHPDDYDRIHTKFTTRQDLVAAMCACAKSVTALVDRVDPHERELLAAATLTFGAQHRGVHANPAWATERFTFFRKVPDLPPAVAVLVDRSNDPDYIHRLAATYRVDRALTRPEPRLLATLVTAAVVVANPSPIGPVEQVVEQVGEALDRGAYLARIYRADGRPVPGSSLPVLGGADFLIALAGYRLAVAQTAGSAPDDDALAEMERDLTGLENDLRAAMTRQSRHLWRDGVREPDSQLFLSHAAMFVGGREAQRVTDKLIRPLARTRLRFDPKPVLTGTELPLIPTGDPVTAESSTIAAQAVAEVADHLAAWTVAGLYEGAVGEMQTRLTAWLLGDRPVDLLDGLEELLGSLRRAMARLPKAARDPAPPHSSEQSDAAGAAARSRAGAALRSRIVAVIDGDLTRGGDLTGRGGVVAAGVGIVAAALPPLWTRRAPAIRGLIAQQRIAGFQEAVAKIVGSVLARGPGQIVQPGNERQHEDWGTCVVDDTLGRCVTRTGDAEPDAKLVCPGRPWGETGRVESYRSLAELSSLSSEAVRKRLERLQDDGGPPGPIGPDAP